MTARWSILLIVVALDAGADVSLPRLLSDGLVLQRDMRANLWGWADDGEVVNVRFDGKDAGSTTTRNGAWQVTLDPCAGGGPHEIAVTGHTTVVIHDVWCGDVWIASGQSNMELTMARVQSRYPAEVTSGRHPAIRQFKVPRAYAFDAPKDDLASGTWSVATPASVLDFSAVAYFFARAVHEHTGVPVGIVSTNVGGSPAEAWMSEKALAGFPHYLEIAHRYRDTAYLASEQDADEVAIAAWQATLDRHDAGLRRAAPWYARGYDDTGWKTMNVPGYWADTDIGPVNGAVWFRKTIDLPVNVAGKPAELTLGRIVDADTVYVNGIEAGGTGYQYPPRFYELDAGILKPGANVLAVRIVNSAGRGGFVEDKPYWLKAGGGEFDLRGPWRVRVGAVADPAPLPRFVDYKQPLGFYNAMLAPLLHMRIKGAIWYQGESNVGRADEYRRLFPAMIRDWREHWDEGDFPFIFVQLANYLEAEDQPVDSEWAELRDAQRQGLTEPATAMAVAIDIGEWNDIHPLDKKTVGERLALAARKVAYGEAQRPASGPVLVSVAADGGGLLLTFTETGDGLRARGGPLAGFALAGDDGIYHWADAEIVGDTVRVASDDVRRPRAVRYAWADNPDKANLYDSAGLPASPFQAVVDP